MILTRDQILGAAPELQHEETEIPEWGGSVHVWELSGKDMDDYQASIISAGKAGKANLRGARARLVVRCARDEAGNRVLRDEDADTINAGPNSPVQRLFNVAARLNRLTEKDVEELAKNSESAQDDSSPTD